MQNKYQNFKAYLDKLERDSERDFFDDFEHLSPQDQLKDENFWSIYIKSNSAFRGF
jgi:hypothetical protein